MLKFVYLFMAGTRKLATIATACRTSVFPIVARSTPCAGTATVGFVLPHYRTDGEKQKQDDDQSDSNIGDDTHIRLLCDHVAEGVS